MYEIYDAVSSYQQIVLVSSDSDIVPIFHEVQLLNRKLEVLYFDINTGAEHKKHINEVGIKNMALESLLKVPTYVEQVDLDSFFNYKISNKAFFTRQLEAINDIIVVEYHKYLKKDSSGIIISGGGASFNALLEGMKSRCICPAVELSKNQMGKYINFLEMLQDKDILYRYDFTYNGKQYYSYLLKENTLLSLGITISDLKKELDYGSSV